MLGTDGAVSNRVLGEGLCDFADCSAAYGAGGDWVPDEHLLIESRQLADRYKEPAWRLNIHFAGTGAWNVELTHDGVYFSESGHRAFTDSLLKVLATMFPDTK